MPTESNNITVTGTTGERAFFFELREPVVFPHSLTPVNVEGDGNRAAADAALKANRLLAIFYEVPDSDEKVGVPYPLSFPSFTRNGATRSAIGVLARIVKELKFPDGSRRVVLRGIRRIRCESLRAEADGAVLCGYEALADREESGDSKEIAARQRSLMLNFQELSSLLPNFPDELQLTVLNTPEPGRFADVVADALNFSRAEKLVLLTQLSVKVRFEVIGVLVNRELEVLRLGLKIQSEVHETLGRSQREFFLREQLRTIQRELGEESANPNLAALHKRFAESGLGGAPADTIRTELERLELIPQSAPEYHIGYNYIALLLDLPWNKLSEERLDCAAARKILDDDHYALEDVKRRILEFLAVLQLRCDKDGRAPILCLVGPPGVGKTSLGRSIARAMNREFVRVSLGGVRDEAEIRGHRRTYVGAMPGRIIKALKRVGTRNPVFMLDEIDKLANDFRGDPASALLEVLDPEQNYAFADNYVELDFDLSKVFFIATANVLDTIPSALRDRMEIIRLPGYTALEKRQIARRYLVPRQIRENGLEGHNVSIPLAAIDAVIADYTMEAGVRELERKLAALCRRIARSLLDGEAGGENGAIRITPAKVREYLGARLFRREAPPAPLPGCALGLAWTEAGGVTLPVECVSLPGGKGELRLTGSLGKVMQESAAAAFSLARSRAAEWGVDPEFFSTRDFHIHVPDGATPKDGPSAGITIFSALVSLLRGKALRNRLAMTGEVTLSGRVTAIGGLREKLVAALRAGAAEVVMPRENSEEYEELPAELRSRLTPHFVADIDEVLSAVFPPAGSRVK